MTIAQQVGRVSTAIETQKATTEFARLAKFILSSGGISKAAFAVERQGSKVGLLGPKLAAIIEAGGVGAISREAMRTKAAQSPLTLATFGADYSAISAGFINSLQNYSCFDGMLGSMVPLPLATGTVGGISVLASAYSIFEGSAKQISRLTVVNQQINPTKAHCALVISAELARSAVPGALGLIARELQASVSVATDAQFISTITSGVSAFTSSGATGESMRSDLSNLLAAITTGVGSRLFLLLPPLVAKRWSMATDQHGLSTFPQLGPLGGTIQNNITCLVSDAVTATQVILADASGLGAAGGEVLLSDLNEASLQFDTSPDSPPSASTPFVSVWQMNERAIRVERWFSCVKIRSDAVAVCSNLNAWASGNSPP